MGIYTKQGDLGETGLPGGERISKNNPRIEAYGTLDELNSVVGVLLLDVPQSMRSARRILRQVQSDLYCAACHLAGTGTPAKRLPEISAARIAALEEAIDDMTALLPELHCFVLPCGCRAAAQAHVARTVCRRAERCLVAFLESLPEGGVGEPLFVILRYVNRLSDYLFTLARCANHGEDIADTPWVAEYPEGRPSDG